MFASLPVVAWWSSGINSLLDSWLLHFHVTILGKLFTHVFVTNINS